ncbi:hypothetical protein ACL7TT_07400 [Microbulbifer sp. 2304DJ12-6]|uniref:hypothetical protein n=1 Tax=Microbulbifer sp. 2304DJ12-6 TaxID=3233340 RepID=UPI0039B0AA8B
MAGARIINEVQLILRQPLCWILAPLAGLFGFFVGRGIHIRQAELFSDPHLLHLVGALCMMALPWATCLLAGFALYRATGHQMYELTLATPLSQARQQAIQATGLCLVLILLGILAALGVQAGLISSAEKLPNTLGLLIAGLKLQGLQLLIGIPAVLLFVSVFWLLRNLSPSPLLVYLGGLLWFISYMLLASASGSPLMASSQTPTPWLLNTMGYLDWFGLSVLMAKQPDLILLGANRILVLLAAFTIAFTAFHLAGRCFASRAKPASQRPAQQRARTPAVFAFTAVKPQGFVQFTALARLQCAQAFKRPMVWLLGLVWCFVVLGETYPSLNQAEPGALLAGLSLDAINRFMWDLVPLFGSMLLLYFSDWLTRRDQRLHFTGILHALPLSPSAVLPARVVSLLTLLLAFLLLTALASIVCQWLKQSPIGLGDYGRFILYAGLPLAALGTVFVAIQAVIQNRLAALLLCFLLLILRFTPLADLLGLHHPLLHPFATPLMPANGYIGYSANLDGFRAFTLFWWLLAALLLLTAILANRQGRKNGVHWRNIPALLGLAALASLLVQQGTDIQTGLDANGRNLDPDSRAAMLADYEKGYRSFAELPMPVIARVNTRVDFFPKQRQVRVSGQYHLENPHAQAVRTLLIGEYWQTPLNHISLDAKAELEYNRTLGQRVYQLATPLHPGQSLSLDFSLVLVQNGYQPLPTHKILTEDFSYLRAIPYFPVIGYLPIRELDSEDLRRQFDLPEKPQQSVEQALASRDKNKDGYDWSLMETQISTPLGYQSFTQGELVESWQQDKRQFRRFVTQQPVRNLQGFIAAPLKLSTRHLDGAKLQVAYLPQHQTNVKMTLDAMAQTVSFLSTHIGPYNGHTLTLVEKPDIGPTGYALPQLLLIGSGVGFRALQNTELPYSQAYRRAVHETAHQWFGHWFGNGIAQDSAFLVESLAKYVELVMLERYRGKAAMLALIAYERARYETAEGHNRQALLSLVSADSPHDQYARATLAFARLRQTVGDTPILAALGELNKKHGYPAPPASSVDFVNALVRQAPAQRELIETLFTRPVPVAQWLSELATEQP